MLSMSANSNKNKLKILCIHGYRQTAVTFKDKLGAFRKLIKNKAELSFVDAPLRVPSTDGEKEFVAAGWWFSRENNSFDALESSDVCIGYDESLNVICKFVKENGPFDGILGFSQGAAFVALLCTLAEEKKLPFEFKFAIIIAGFKSRCSSHVNMYNVQTSMPSLHVFGETDKVIPIQLSKELAQHFTNPTVICHAGGHFLPVTGQEKQLYLTFLDKNCS